jgi:hypothetical protein
MNAAAQEEFACDESGFDGFAEAHVIGNEEVDARETEGLVEGF